MSEQPAPAPAGKDGIGLGEAHFWIALTIFGAGIYLVRDEPLWGGPLLAIGVVWLIYSLRQHFAPNAYKIWIVLFAMAAASLTSGFDIYQRIWGTPNVPSPAPAEVASPASNVLAIGSAPPTASTSFTEEPSWEDAIMIERAFFALQRPCVAKLVPLSNETLRARNVLSAILRVNGACEIVDEQTDQVPMRLDADAPTPAKFAGLVVRWNPEFAGGVSWTPLVGPRVVGFKV